MFSELQSHYLFADRFGRPGKGNDKGKVEGLVGWIRRNYLVPMPRAASFAALNAKLLDDCRRRLGDRLRGHAATIGERLVRDLAVFQSLPATPYDACEKKTGRVSSLSLVRYRGADYSVPTAYGHREVLIRGYVDLAFLAPEIVEAILAGTQPVDLTAEALTKRTDLPLSWAEQKALLGFD